MTTVFNKSGTRWVPANARDMVVESHLPGINLTVKQDPMSGTLFFEEIESFQHPPKVYGNAKERAQRILNTFLDRPVQTGVLLGGEKGSGKSMLAKLISTLASEINIPTLTVNAPWTGDQFFQLIQRVEQPMVVLFDEFEKVYNPDKQKEVLTLLDGVFPTKKLFILTVNDMYAVDRHMHNRPGRLFYNIQYKGLDERFIREYCADRLKDTNPKTVEQILNVSRLFSTDEPFNFDMLKALVEEMNRYDERPAEALEMLNISPRRTTSKYMVREVTFQGIVVPTNMLMSEYVWGSPLFEDDIEVEIRVPTAMSLPPFFIHQLRDSGQLEAEAASLASVLDAAALCMGSGGAPSAATPVTSEAQETGTATTPKTHELILSLPRTRLVSSNVSQGTYVYKEDTPEQGRWSVTLVRERAAAPWAGNSWNHL